jgi:AmpD protein
LELAGSTDPSALAFDAEGRLLRALQISSPNQDERPQGTTVSLLVVHNISLPPGEFGGTGVVDLFLNRLDPDAHPFYQGLRGLIRRDGELIQFVPCERRAWHAGVSRWRGRERCNDFSIGIELEGSDYLAFSEPQYAELARLTRDLYTRYPLQDIAGHADIAPGRKTDPGPCFDWTRYRALIGAELDR